MSRGSGLDGPQCPAREQRHKQSISRKGGHYYAKKCQQGQQSADIKVKVIIHNLFFLLTLCIFLSNLHKNLEVAIATFNNRTVVDTILSVSRIQRTLKTTNQVHLCWLLNHIHISSSPPVSSRRVPHREQRPGCTYM